MIHIDSYTEHTNHPVHPYAFIKAGERPAGPLTREEALTGQPKTVVETLGVAALQTVDSEVRSEK